KLSFLLKEIVSCCFQTQAFENRTSGLIHVGEHISIILHCLVFKERVVDLVNQLLYNISILIFCQPLSD
ncbi:hypothetical protein SAMN05660742_1251, partial [Propionispira arboris]